MVCVMHAAVVCASITPPANGAVSVSGDTVTFSCNAGYSLSGSTTIMCDPVTRKWQGNVPSCEGVFDYLQKHENETSRLACGLCCPCWSSRLSECSCPVPAKSHEPGERLRDGDEWRLVPVDCHLHVQCGLRHHGLEPRHQPVHSIGLHCQMGKPIASDMHRYKSKCLTVLKE